MSRVGRRLRRLRWPWIGPVLGAALGLGLASRCAGHFTTPQPLAETGWELVSPKSDKTVLEPSAGRGTHILDGALVITEHVFYRSDTVRIPLTGSVQSIEVELAPDSGRVAVIAADGPSARVDVDPRSVTVYQPGPREIALVVPVLRLVRGDAGWQVEFDDQSVGIGAFRSNQLEFETVSGRSRIRRIRVLDTSGQPMVDRDFSGEGLPARPWLWGLLLGAFGGWAAGVRTSKAGPSGAAWASVWLALPIGVCAVSPAGWLRLVEVGFFTETSAWTLARYGLVAAMLPIALAGFSAMRGFSMDARDLRREGRADVVVWAAVAVASLWLGGRGLGLGGLLVLTLFVAMPGILVFRRSIAASGWLRRDLPALVVVAVFGWGLGVLLALVWRWTVLLSSLSGLVRQAPRATAELAFAMILTVPIAAEATVRASYLGQIWTPDGIQVGALSEQDGSRVKLAWSGSCGPTDAPEVRRLAFAGGSSTGGAYQFANEPDAFFAVQAHQLLCADLPDGVRLETFNFGDGDRTSFTISRTLQQLVDISQPDVLVLYLGVNDVFTKRGTKTAKEREIAQGLKPGSVGLLGRLGAESRLIVGLGAMLRASQHDQSRYVADVPVVDASENLRQIAGELGDGAVLLMTEQVRSGNRPQLKAYDEMQRQVAVQVDNIAYIDATAGLGEDRIDALLADRNHLTREGGREVAALLVPELHRLLGLSPPP